MNKKLLTAAVGAAIAATSISANAEVKVFGAAQFELSARTATTEVEDAAGTVTSDTSTFTGDLSDNQRGRFGFKASEDLGNGMKGLAHIEYDTQGEGNNSGGKTCGGLGCGSGERQIWAGIKGKFGLISGGSHHGTYKTFGGVKWDPFVATHLQARGANGMSGGSNGHNNFWDHSVRYVSPKLGPVTIQFMRGFQYNDVKDDSPGVLPEDETEGGGNDDSRWALGAKGKFGPAEVVAVYAVAKQDRGAHGTGDDVAIEDSSRIKLGGRFALGKMHKIAVQLESIVDQGVADNSEAHFYINWTGKFGKIHPMVAFGNYARVSESQLSASDFIEVGTMLTAAVAWRPSKTFRVFGGVRTTANVTEEETRTTGAVVETTTETSINYSIGVRKDF